MSATSEPDRVLVRLPSWLGDFVMAEPAVRALAERFGEAALTFVAAPALQALLDGRFPLARRVSAGARGASAWRGHALAVLCTGSFRSAWSAFRAGIPRRAGFARDGRAWLLTDVIVPATERGATPLGLGRSGRGRRVLPRPLGRSLAELLGLLGVPVADARPRLDVSAAGRATAQARRAQAGLDPDAPFVLVNAGARAGSSKGVPPVLWAAALGALRDAAPELAFVLACGPGEEEALDTLARLLDVHARVLVLRDPVADLAELLAHAAEARLFLGGDTGPRHLARAVETPAVIVAGPTDPRHCGVDERERLVRVVVPCGPCHVELCPLAGDARHACMRRIEPGSVAASALELLALREDRVRAAAAIE